MPEAGAPLRDAVDNQRVVKAVELETETGHNEAQTTQNAEQEVSLCGCTASLTAIPSLRVFAFFAAIQLQQANIMAGDPDFELLKTLRKDRFEIDEKLIVFGGRRHIDEEAHQLVLVPFFTLSPGPHDRLTLGGHGAETSFEFAEGLSQAVPAESDGRHRTVAGAGSRTADILS